MKMTLNHGRTGLSGLRRAFAVTMLAVLWLTAACDEAPQQHAVLPEGSVVLAIGDSVTHGVGARSGADYPSQLAAISGWRVHNFGVSGDTSAGVRNRIAAALEQVRPQLVILEIGGNDFLRREPADKVKQNIRATIVRVKEEGIPLLLVATPQFSPLGAAIGALSDAPLYAELAQEENVAIVADVFAAVLSDNDLKSDPIHPNAEGYRRLAAGIAMALQRYGFLAP